jgi:hypothetical protein
MSYSLELHFEPAVRRDRVLQHFAARRHFSVKKHNILYKNPDTGVYFFMSLRCARSVLLRSKVVSAEFDINYFRPSLFGIEAEREMSAFMAAFQPRIEDPQMHGMGERPYSSEGFLSGWNFGNAFSVHNALSSKPDRNMPSMPADQLRTAWEWNYHLAECNWRNPNLFVPMIMFFHIEGRPSRVVIWPEGIAALLPRADYVLVGRVVSGEARFGLARWSEVLEVVRRAGLDATQDPLKPAYLVTPSPIADWVANIPLIDLEALERLSADRILDGELITAARESIERQGTFNPV